MIRTLQDIRDEIDAIEQLLVSVREEHMQQQRRYEGQAATLRQLVAKLEREGRDSCDVQQLCCTTVKVPVEVETYLRHFRRILEEGDDVGEIAEALRDVWTVMDAHARDMVLYLQDLNHEMCATPPDGRSRDWRPRLGARERHLDVAVRHLTELGMLDLVETARAREKARGT